MVLGDHGQLAFVYRSISILCRNLNCNSMWTNQEAVAATTRWVAHPSGRPSSCSGRLQPGNGSIAF